MKTASSGDDNRLGVYYIPPKVGLFEIRRSETLCQSNDSFWHTPDPGYGEGTEEEPLD